MELALNIIKGLVNMNCDTMWSYVLVDYSKAKTSFVL